MAIFEGRSDQLYKWSDRHGESTDQSAPTPCWADTAASVDGTAVSKGLADRALQAMWQARVQVCPGARPWSQALSFGQPIRTSAGDDLCAAARRQASRSLSCESGGCPRTAGGDLRDKPGAVKSARGFLSSRHGACGITHPLGVCRLFGGRHSGGQYDSGLSVRAVASEGGRP